MNHVIIIVELVFFFGGIIAFGLWQIHAINKRQRARAAVREAAPAQPAPASIRVVKRS